MRCPERAEMRFDALIVPRGAEARAVERGWSAPAPPIVRVPAGAAAGDALGAAAPLQTVLVLGLCGALDPALHVGDTVVYSEIVDGVQRIPLDAGLAAECAAALGTRTAPALNVDTVVGDVAQKSALRSSTAAVAVDMEAAAIAHALAARRVRVAMVRVVSDDAAGELPDLRGVYDAGGGLRPLALTLAFARTPLRSARFIANVMRALAALRATARLLSR